MLRINLWLMMILILLVCFTQPVNAQESKDYEDVYSYIYETAPSY